MSTIKRGSIRQSVPFARIMTLCVLLIGPIGPADAADDAATSAARASLERIQALRKERSGDVVLVFYQALTHMNLGEREAAFDLLRSLKGRKLGSFPCAASGSIRCGMTRSSRRSAANSSRGN